MVIRIDTNFGHYFTITSLIASFGRGKRQKYTRTKKIKRIVGLNENKSSLKG
jgi:hypothetical protein